MCMQEDCMKNAVSSCAQKYSVGSHFFGDLMIFPLEYFHETAIFFKLNILNIPHRA